MHHKHVMKGLDREHWAPKYNTLNIRFINIILHLKTLKLP